MRLKMRKKYFISLMEKYESLKKEFKYHLIEQEVGGSIERLIKGMPVDNNGNSPLIVSNIFNGVEICRLNKPVGYLSGDYNDCIDIGEGKIAIIQCDVSGKGASASLFSTVVVSLFKSYCLRFSNWSSESLIRLLEEINTILESMDIKGRFAAIQLGIIDSVKKEYISTNAGLNVFYILRNNKKLEIVEFPEAPAAGVFPTDMVNLNSGFKLSRIKLQDGDILLFPGDGFDESQRYDEKNEMEDFGINRLQKYLYAIFRKEYVFSDWIRVNFSTHLLLDYSNDSGKLEDSLGSLLATELLYRLKKEPKKGWEDSVESESIPVNKELVDALLRITSSSFFEKFIERTTDEYGNEILMIKKDRIEPQFDDLSFMAVRVDDNLKKDFTSHITELSKLPDPDKMEDCDVKEEIDKFEGIEELEEIEELVESNDFEELDEIEEVEEVE